MDDEFGDMKPIEDHLKPKPKYNENVTWDWCWECNSYHRTEAGQPRNTKCSNNKRNK